MAVAAPTVASPGHGRGARGLSQLFLLRDSGEIQDSVGVEESTPRSISGHQPGVGVSRVHPERTCPWGRSGRCGTCVLRGFMASSHAERERRQRERMQSDDAVWPYVQRSQKCPPRCPVSIPRSNGPAVLRARAAVLPASLTRCTEQPYIHTAQIQNEHPPCGRQSAPISDEPSVVTCPGAAYQRSPPYHACVCV